MSLFPGLGLLTLGKVRSAAIVFGLFLLLAGYGLFGPLGFFTDLIFNLAFALWAIQIVYAFQVAKREELAGALDPRAAKPAAPVSKPVAGIGRPERMKLAALQVLEPQLEPKEALLAAVWGLDMGSVWLLGTFAMKQLHIGVTKDHLIRVQMDMMGKPYQVHRHGLRSVTSAWLKHGLVQDRLRIQVDGEKGNTYRVQRAQREESQLLLELLTRHSGN
ncbi:MAG: hypothetical protein KIS88_02915 [Anaerolineales bacterium]|nr:hypothetical protein [Anaerolineales bacterium]